MPPTDATGPITWTFIRTTFTTKERTRDLLAPELERSLNHNDFERAVQFLPGSQRYWPVRSHFKKLHISGETNYGELERSRICIRRRCSRLWQPPSQALADRENNHCWRAGRARRGLTGAFLEFTRTCELHQLSRRSTGLQASFGSCQLDTKRSCSCFTVTAPRGL